MTANEDSPEGASRAPSQAHIEAMNQLAHSMTQFVPWARAMGFQVTRIEEGRAFATQPYDPRLVGDLDTGVIHGGVLTTLLDNLCGIACAAALGEVRSVATLDLRIDYMRPAERDRDIIGEAECYHVTRSVCFTRAWAYHENRDRVIATAAGAFAITQR